MTVEEVVEMPHLTTTDRERAIGKLQPRVSLTEVARRLNCSIQTIVNLRRRLQSAGSTANRPRPGQPRVTTNRQDDVIRQFYLRNRFVTTMSTARQVVRQRGQVSASTFQRAFMHDVLMLAPHWHVCTGNVACSGQLCIGDEREASGPLWFSAMSRD